MANYSRLTVGFAAAIGIAAMLSSTLPAVAAATAHGTRSPGHGHAVGPVRSELYCPAAWRGRVFALMVGIAY
jgi:hypothetical protein